MIFFSDATHPTNFSSDKKAWPVYMTIGNLSTTIRMASSYHGILLIALLPIPIKMCDVPISRYNAQKEHNRMIQQHVLRHVLGPLMDAERRVFYARCAHDYFRRCVEHLLPGSLTTQNTETFTTSRMAFVTGANAHPKKWANFRSNLVSVGITPCTEGSVIWIPQQQRHVLLITGSTKVRMFSGISTALSVTSQNPTCCIHCNWEC